MRLIFTRLGGTHDQLEVVRGDGSTEIIPQPKQRIIPHDMVHAIVEAELAGGFLDAVNAGAGAAFARGQWGKRALAVERLVEAVQAAAWSGGAQASDILYLYRTACDARGHPAWPVDGMLVGRVMARLALAQAQWDALPVGGRVEFGHPARAVGPAA